MNVVYRFDSDNGAIDASGRFQLRHIIGRAIFVTGFKDFRAGGMGWSIKSVTLNGADITDTPIDIPSAGEISESRSLLQTRSRGCREQSPTLAANQSETTSSSFCPSASRKVCCLGASPAPLARIRKADTKSEVCPQATTLPSRSRHSNLATSGIPHSANRSSPAQNVFD